MSLFAAPHSLVTTLFRRSHVAEDLEEAVRSHVEHRADDLERIGMSRAEAERQTRIEFGARERIREETGEAMGGNLLDGLWHDVKYALRVLGKAKGFAVAATMVCCSGPASWHHPTWLLAWRSAPPARDENGS